MIVTRLGQRRRGWGGEFSSPPNPFDKIQVTSNNNQTNVEFRSNN